MYQIELSSKSCVLYEINDLEIPKKQYEKIRKNEWLFAGDDTFYYFCETIDEAKIQVKERIEEKIKVFISLAKELNIKLEF